ncbi:hypothetical protein [Spirosoma sp. KUDC1026]|uniref:hypothetical protein n=1 Tax=Spirosoma sp. KUDC1026 TaxID=2745947 RepID=UPI00159BE672|nr:hypothetical protein [Spirosoma sp. KUDC1026]QKZ14180.1 hypothetical protein HU175_16720 [Spirosoma sp. KUDC1026]
MNILVFKPRVYVLFSLSIFLLASGCMSSRRASEALQRVAQDHCEIDSSHTSGYVFRPASMQVGSAEETLLRGRYGPRALRMAQAVGLIPLLTQLTKLEAEETGAGSTPSTAYLTVRQRISDQLQLATADIATASALLDCDTKRATLTATLLTRRENIREKRMTISAITIGAVAIIGASILNLHEEHVTADWLHVAGGVGEGALGVLALRQKPPRIAYSHVRNPLREIWERPKLDMTGQDKTVRSTLFAPLVWYYLNQPRVGKRQTVVTELREHWEVLTSLNAAGKRAKKPHHEVDYFGAGDDYDAEALTLRATMLGELETEIKLMNNDLTILLNEIVSQKKDRTPQR